MAPSNQVEVIEFCKIAPPPHSVAPASLPLTFFDLIWLPYPPQQFLYFYEFPHPLTHFTHTLLPRIKHSLSLTLLHFYPFAGNLSWPEESPNPMVHYKDGDSVSLTVAQSEGGFHRFSGNQARESKESHSLLPQLSVSGSAIPVLALQFTVFPNSGISFGFSFHHSIADARTLTHFINSWTSICKLGKPSLSTESLPLYDRTLIKDPKGIEKIFMNQLAIFFQSESGERRLSKVVNYSRASNAVRTTFQLSRADVARLKERILAQHRKDKRSQPPRLSTFTVVCAYVWVCLVQSGDERIHFLINMDCRSRLDPSVPWTYFGNCIGNRVVKVERDDLLEHDAIAKAAKLIEEKTKQLEKGIFDGAEFWLSHILSAGADPKFGAIGSNHLGFYKADFGWGRPKKVELVSIDRSGLLFIAENPNDRGGAEISLTFEKHEMDVFSSMFCNGLSAEGN